MSVLKIGFTDYGMNPDWFMSILSKRYDVVRDDANPNILIFGDENFGQNNLTYDHNRVLKIFMTGENRRFYNYKCHMGITFDHIDDTLHFRIPLYIHEMHSLKNESKYDEPIEIVEKSGFATFVVGNGTAQRRNELFHLVNSYKTVDSGGPHLNNIGHVIPRDTRTKIDFMKTRKFHLAFENSSYPGYVTEKILQAFYARTVPIYWGSPCVDLDFNPDAFINWHDYKNDKKFLEKIIEVDNDEKLYHNMLNQPMFRNNKFLDMDIFLDWWEENVMGRLING